MARSIVSFGMLTSRPLSTAVRRRGLPLMSPPPSRAETVISLMTLVHIFDFLASEASFLCLILDHRLCPDMPLSYHVALSAGRRGHSGPAPGIGGRGVPARGAGPLPH